MTLVQIAILFMISSPVTPRTTPEPSRCSEAEEPVQVTAMRLDHTAGGIHGRPDLGQMMKTVAQRVVFNKELAGQRSVGVERNRGGPIQLRIRQGPYSRRGALATAPQESQRRRPVHVGMVSGVSRIHLVHGVPCDSFNGRAAGQGLGQLNLQRVDTGDVMDDDAHRPTVFRDRQAPLGFRQGSCVPGESRRSFFDPDCEGISALGHGNLLDSVDT
jgi:hypothetical protein